MKIGFLINYFYPMKGGAENNCFYLAKELAKKHEVHVFTSLLPRTKKNETLDNIHIHRYKTKFRYKYYLSFTPGLLNAILKEDLDMLHLHSFGFLYHDLIMLLKSFTGNTKLINTPHGPFMALKNYNLIEMLFKFFISVFERIINNKYDAVIQVNPDQEKWLTDYGISKEKIFFLPNGINKDSFEKIDNKDFIKKYNLKNKFVVSYLGRIQKYKGLEQVIKVLPRLNKNVVFLVMGKDSGDLSRLKTLSNNLKIRERIIFTSELSDDDVIKGLSVSKIFILSSEWEAFGISILQAMAQGNAIISTRTEGGRFLIKENENGFLFDYNNLDELKSKLNLLIKNKNSLNKIGKNNIKKAKKFLWNNISENLEKVYKSLLAR